MLTKVYVVKAMVFPVVMYRCESWTIKKAEHWRTDAFKLWCWRRLLRIPWIARRLNQSILKDQHWIFIGSTDTEAEVPILYLMWRANSLEKTLMLRKTEGRRRRCEMVGWHHQLNEHASEQTPGNSEGQGSLAYCNLWGCKESDTI